MPPFLLLRTKAPRISSGDDEARSDHIEAEVSATKGLVISVMASDTSRLPPAFFGRPRHPRTAVVLFLRWLQLSVDLRDRLLDTTVCAIV